MSDFREVQPLSPTATIDEMRQALSDLILWMRARDPSAAGDDAAKFLTVETAVSTGLLRRNGSFGFVGGGGFSFDPGDYTPGGSDWDDSPPSDATGLTVTSVRTGFVIEIDPPNYSQGGENDYTELWGAKYSGTGPLPTFADAAEVGQLSGKSPLFFVEAEPGVQMHFWVGTVTRGGIRQIDVSGPTGGTNGVYAVAGKLSDDHIASLSVVKLTTGEVDVGTTIQSSGYTGTNTYEWRIDGTGVARFSGVVVKGTIYAAAGEIGGASIYSSYVQSTSYDGAGNGWRLDNALGKIFAGKILISNVGATRVLDTEATGTDPVLKIGSVLEIKGNGDASLGTLDLTGALRSGQTAFDTGAGFWLGKVSGTPKLSIGDASHAMLWTGSALQLRGVEIDTFSASIGGGAISFSEPGGDPWPSRTVTLSGGRSPFVYQWMLIHTKYEPATPASEKPMAVPMILLGSTTATCTVKGVGANISGDTAYGHLGCLVTDANGRVTFARVSFTMTFNGPSPGEIGSAE